MFYFLFFLIFNFIAFASICAQMPKTRYGIELEKVEDHYLRLLFDQSLGHSEQNFLSIQLSAVRVHFEIEKRMKILQKANGKKKTNKNDLKIKFNKIVEKIEMKNGKIRLTDVCVLCNFWLYIEAIRNKKAEDFEKRQEMDKYCEQLEGTKNPSEKLQDFVRNLNKFISDCHFIYLDNLLTEKELRKNSNFRQIFKMSNVKPNDESELTQRFKLLNARNEFEQIKQAKRIMETFLMDQQSVDQLELNNPILLAIGIQTDGFWKMLFEGMNMIDESDNVMFIELSILCAKIIAHFAENGDKENNPKNININSYKNYWKRFDQILSKNEDFRKESAKRKILDELSRLLGSMNAEFGTPKATKRLRVMINDLQKCLIGHYEQLERFRDKFIEKTKKWNLVKELFESAYCPEEESDQILWNKFMKLFDADSHGIEMKKTNDQKFENFFLKMENQKENAKIEGKKDSDAIIVMTLYMKLLSSESPEDFTEKSDLLQNLEVNTILWYYRRCFKVLLEFAEMLIEFKNGNSNFKDRIEKYKNKGQSQKNVEENRNDRKREMCKTYKLANELAFDQTLSQINSDWKLEIEKFVNGERQKDEISKYMQMTVLPENGEIEWKQMNCENEKLIEMFLDEMRKTPRIENIHFFAIKNLVEQNENFKDFFYKGISGEGNFVRIKENLVQVVNTQLMFKLESLFPDVFHFEVLLPAQYVTLLSHFLQFKSGTFGAEMFEMQIMAPLLVSIIATYEEKLANNAQNLPTNAENALLEKIENAKAQFFGKLRNMKNQRKSLCQLSVTAKFVEQFLINQQKSEGKNAKNLTKIAKWKPTECKTQIGIKRAIEEVKKQMRSVHFEFLEKVLRKNEFVKDEFNKIGGAKERIRKLLTDGTDIEKEAKAEQIMAMFRTPHFVHEAFSNAPLDKFYEETVTEKVEAQRVESWMKADIVVFAQWVQLALGQNAKRLPFLREFWEKNKYSFMELYDRILDSEISEIKLRELEFTYLIKDYWDKVMNKCTKMSLNGMEMEEKLKKLLCFEQTTEKVGETYRNWIKNLHYDTLSQLMTENEQIKNKFQKIFGSSTEAVNILLNFFGIERANDILRICESGAEIKVRAIKEILTDILAEKEEKKVAKNKSKNKGKKVNKKEQNEENSIKINEIGKSESDEKLNLNDQLTTAEQNTKSGEAEELNGQKNGEKKGKAAKDEKEVIREKKSDKAKETNCHNAKVPTNDKKETNGRKTVTEEKAELSKGNAPIMRNDEEIGEKEKREDKRKETTNSNDKVTTINKMPTAEIKFSKNKENLPNLELRKIGKEMANSNDKIMATENGSEIEQKSGENGEEHLAEEAAAEDKLDLNELIGLKIGHFWEDNLLNLKYGELFWEVSKDNYWAQNVTVKTLSWTLHFGVYANEISHRIGILGDEISEELEIISKNEKWEIEKQWEKLKTVELSDQIMRQSERSKLMAKLHLLLKKIVAKMDDGFWGENGTNLWEEIGQIKSQLHSRKLAKAMAGSETERQTMPHLDKVILALIQTANNGPNEDKMPKHRAEFEEQLRAAKQFNEQRKLDKKLFKQLTEEANLTKFVEEKEWEKFRLKKLAKFPEEWQEIKYEENAIENEEKTKQIKDFINQNYSTDEKIKENKWKKANEELEKIIGEWSSDVRIQFSSLSHLKIQLEQMDAICLFPHGFDQRNIFGRFCCDNLDKKEEKCLDQSLNCTLCMHSNVNSLQKITKTQKHLIPRMTFKFMDLLFEVKFVIMPNIGQLPPGKYSWKEFEQFETEIGNKIEQLIKNDQFDMGMCKYDLKDRAKMREELVKKMANSADSNRLNYSENIEKLDEICNFLIKQKKMAIKNRKFVNELNAMLQTLAEFTFYAKIYEEFLNETEKQKEGTKADKFSQILAYLELWAKNNQIFDDSMGYLNTKMLLIMLTKLFIFYPNASMPFLVDKFFLTFSTWNWPLPVQLAEINYGREDGFLSWSPFREWVAKRQATDQHLRAVFRQQLTMPTITPTFPEQNFGANLNGATAKVILNELKIAFKRMRNDKNFILPLKGKTFTEKYSHFISIVCFGHQINVVKLTQFLKNRIRYELFESLQQSSSLSKCVHFFHVNPKIFPMKVPSAAEHNNSKKNQLLVGIELFQPMKLGNSELKNEFNQMLKIFNAKIKSDFNHFLFHVVEISSEYVEKSELIIRGIDEEK